MKPVIKGAGKRSFEKEKTANTEVLRQERTCHIREIKKQLVSLERWENNMR